MSLNPEFLLFKLSNLLLRWGRGGWLITLRGYNSVTTFCPYLMPAIILYSFPPFSFVSLSQSSIPGWSQGCLFSFSLSWLSWSACGSFSAPKVTLLLCQVPQELHCFKKRFRRVNMTCKIITALAPYPFFSVPRRVIPDKVVFPEPSFIVAKGHSR